MKKILAIIIILLVVRSVSATQDPWLQSIKHQWSVAGNDTSRVLALVDYCSYYKFKRPDSAMFYGAKALTLARQIEYPKGELLAMNLIALSQNTFGNPAKALQLALQAIKIAEKHHLIQEKAGLLFLQGLIYSQMKNYEKAMSFYIESKSNFDSLHNATFSALAQTYIGDAFLKLNQPDSALHYCQLSYDNRLKESWVSYFSTFNLGKVQEMMGNTNLALALFRQSLSLSTDGLSSSNLAIAQLYQKNGKLDSCIYYGEKSLALAQESKFISNIIDANLFLSGVYEKTNTQIALQYSKTAIALKDSLFILGNKTAQETFIDFDEQERHQEIETAKTYSRNRIRMNAFLGSIFTLLVIAFFLYRNNRLKQKAKQSIEKAYDQLKSTQSQLIQSEKMASLGELTAGIAHEIQNPLNFVNNFSELNKEMLGEMNEEIEKGNMDEVKAIARDVIENEEKIIHHGKRADAIVKGMLQHSRTSTGVKEPTDINALADEYLRLAYHGLRAKDKSFNATMNTDFDESIGKIDVIPQDIGRVILNLITNAFYAVQVQTQNSTSLQYEPTVWVSTKKMNGKIEIRVKDNGPGIPSSIVDKIFQPFFTTKPTGQGTGLGLSLSYDIVKAHGGEIKVETKDGEGTEFIIIMPVIS